MADTVRIIGNYLSPYVRKVLLVLDLKGLPYEIDPIIPRRTAPRRRDAGSCRPERARLAQPCCASSQRSASIAAMQPEPAAVTACR